MKALSIRQPWAWLILNAGKDVENRAWSTKFRGEFLIHASQGCTQDEYWDAVEFARIAIADSYRGIKMPSLKNMPRGAFVGKANLIDCSKSTGSKWQMMDQWGFVLASPVQIEPVPYKGQLGFFEVGDYKEGGA